MCAQLHMRAHLYLLDHYHCQSLATMCLAVKVTIIWALQSGSSATFASRRGSNLGFGEHCELPSWVLGSNSSHSIGATASANRVQDKFSISDSGCKGHTVVGRAPTVARQGCAMVRRWRFFASFLRPVFPVSRMQHISDLHSKFALGPHHVWKYGRHPICGCSD